MKIYLIESIEKEMIEVKAKMDKFKAFMKDKKWQVCFVVGMSGIISIFFLIHLSAQSQLIGNALQNKMKDISSEATFSSVAIPLALAFIAGISFVLLLFAVLGNAKSPKAGLKGLISFVCLILLGSGYITFGLSGNYGIGFVIVVWLCFSWLVWMLMEVFKALQTWSSTPAKETQNYDPVKLSLIWAVLAFILGRFI